MSEILNIAKQAKQASKQLLNFDNSIKNEILIAVANELVKQKELIKSENLKDIQAGKNNGLSASLLDRLTLSDDRIKSMSEGLKQIAMYADPIGEVLGGWKHKNGLNISKVRVPLGVLGMIYESRPNVTIDVAALALKSQNAVILRGSASAIHSNIVLEKIFNQTGSTFGLPSGAVTLIKDTSRQSIDELIRMDDYIDVLIPRGGKSLKEHIVKNATIPVIQTGAGVCHMYVDESADISDAVRIIKNAKTQRPSVCNAIECVLLHRGVVDKIMPVLIAELSDVELRLESEIYENYDGFENVKKASELDLGSEFLDMILLVKVVDCVNDAICYINEYSSGHSDAILSKDYENLERFLNTIDSAVVYANASTRFSDGGEFGFGGEIGISTQKLHARGPMGVRELTTYKYIVRGNGQIR